MTPLSHLFRTRLRGFRIVDLSAFGCLAATVLGVYALKAHAGGESARIVAADAQIGAEQRRIRLLKAELARLEQPSRLERLSGHYLGLEPVSAKRETRGESLVEVAREAGDPPKLSSPR